MATLSLLAGWLGTAAEFDWHAGPGHRWAELPVPGKGHTGFTPLTGAQTGLTFTNLLADERGIANRNLLSGSGLAAGDVDGDGWCDLYLCGLDHGDRLYRNLGGWKFADITAAAGLARPGQDSTGAVFADVDGDGHLDLLVASLGHGVRAFRNDGKGHFTQFTEAAGLTSRAGSMSLALADVDGDGDLDLYVANYRPTTVMDQPRTSFKLSQVEGRPVVATVNGVPATAPEYTNRFTISPDGSVLELGEPDVLYLNDGKGRFSAVSFTGGAFLDEDGKPLADPPRDWGLSVAFHDINGDGAPDLYVCNDLFSPDRIWINDGHGKFRAIATHAIRTTSTFSMGIDFGDLNRDGFVDFMVVDMLATGHKDRHTQVSTQPRFPFPIGLIDSRMQAWRNTLELNRGDTTFAEVAFYGGVEASNWSWMPLFLDVDLDGYEDILIPNGQMRDFQNVDMANRIDAERAARPLTPADITRLLKMFPNFSTPGIAFRNRHDLTFEETGAAWGWNVVGVSQGTACADFDHDGDLDVVVNRLNEEAGVFRNDGIAPRLAVRLKGAGGNAQGIGARITVTGGPVVQTQEVISGGHYLAGADPLRTFAAGGTTNQLKIAVAWRNGRQTEIADARPNRLYEIEEPAAPAAPPARPAVAEAPAWFEDATASLRHVHHEDPFDDFERQPLLPNRLSQLGPGIAWHDLDGDGWEDLIIGSGRGGPLAIQHNDGRGGFTPVSEAFLQRPAPRDQTAILAIGGTLFVGAANYEDGQTNGGCLRIFDTQRKASGDSVMGNASSAGPLAFGALDGAGPLSLFIGGRVVPGRYPEPATSLLLRNEGGRFVVAQRFDRLGLVSGAVFTDLDADGRPELALACEWGPIRLFRQQGGQFVAWDPPVTVRPGPGADALAGATQLHELTGWWTGIAAGDLDGDGRLDLIAANWGLNHHARRASVAHPRRLYYGDLDGSGTVDLIEAYFDAAMGKEVPDRGYQAVVAAMPFVQEKAPTYEAYGTASVQELYGERLENAGRVEVAELASMVYFNRGDHFEAVPLPAEAQWAPAFGVCVGDADGDGHEDVFLSQNFFATAVDSTPCDAGRGLWLRGDGQGNLKAVSGQESGVMVYGEQRGCAVGDYDHDGRLDLVVTQNGNATRLFHNRHARPGLRVRVQGGPANPAGIGSVIRLSHAGKSGPAREIHAGAGYWSTDASTQIMTLPEPATRISVRFPGGKEVAGELPPGAKEVEVSVGGEIRATP